MISDNNDNSTDTEGGGIHASGVITVKISNSLINSNTADADSGGSGGGGIHAENAGITLNVKNTIISENLDTATASNCAITNSGVIASSGYNIDDADSCGFAGIQLLLITRPGNVI